MLSRLLLVLALAGSALAQPLSPETCMFGNFDFSSLAASPFDLVSTSSGISYFINPCGQSRQPNCLFLDPQRSASMCSCNVALTQGDFVLCSPLSTSVIIQDRAPLVSDSAVDTPVWSFIGGSASNGVQYSLSNGQACPANPNIPITTIVRFICGPATPTLDPVTNIGCTFTAVVRTSLACSAGAPSSTGPALPSSTGAASSTAIGVSSSVAQSSSGPLIIGDPQFVGLRGQSFQVHGIDGEFYNLVSSTTSQVNAQFVFLNEGSCPVIDGIVQTNCWSHPGSYLGAIGVQQIVGDHVNRLHLVAGAAQQGFESVKVNDREIQVGDATVDTDAFSVSFESTHRVRCQIAEYEFVFDSSDMFINQGISMRVPLDKLTSHGLIGQTHQSKLYPTAIKYIAGEIDDYLIDERDIWGSSFVFNRFNHQ